MKENPILKLIQYALGSNTAVKIFRNNTGMGWQGETVREFTENGNRYIVLKNPRPLHAGLIKGSSDLIGWKSVKVTAEMIGQKIAIFSAIEVKSDVGRATKEQITFLQILKDSGGLCGVARTETEAKNILGI